MTPLQQPYRMGKLPSLYRSLSSPLKPSVRKCPEVNLGILICLDNNFNSGMLAGLPPVKTGATCLLNEVSALAW